MGDRSLIEWTDATWNPLIGCSKVGAGCDNCYAIRTVHRGLSEQHRGLTVAPEGGGAPDWTGEVREVRHRLDQPLLWRRPRRIFVNSLSDLFHLNVTDQYIAEVFAVMARAPQHTFQVLTKRPQRMATLLSSFNWRDELARQLNLARVPGPFRWPLPNVWLGTSIESNRWAFRADHLRHTPAAVRWVSAEPLLGPLDQLDLRAIDWLVVGGESGPGSRPMHPQWVRDLRDRCASGWQPAYDDELGGEILERRPGPAFHFKQWGDWTAEEPPTSAATRHAYVWSSGAEPTPEAPAMMWRVGKGTAGRELDGRTWDEWPAGHEQLATT